MQLILDCQPCERQCSIVRAPWEFTASTASGVHRELIAALVAGCQTINLDCSETRHIDSAAIGAVIAAHRSFVKEGGEIRWSEVNDDVASLLELTRVDRLMFVKRCSLPV